MTYYLKDWFLNLKHCNTFEADNYSINDENTNQNTIKTNLQKTYNRLILLLNSTSSLLTINCFILGFLTKYLVTGDQLSGLQFLVVTFVVLTSCLFYYPSYNLIDIGYINLRIIRWIYSLTVISTFFFLLRNHTKACSSVGLCGTIGLKILREIPFIFPKTFTFNELLIISSFISCGAFTFFMHMTQIFKPENDEVVVIEQAIIWLILVTIFTSQIGKKSLVLFVSGCMLALALYFVPMCFVLIKKNPFLWLIDYLFYQNQKRILIFGYWLSLFFFMSFVIFLIKLKETKDKKFLKDSNRHKKLTKIRKIFHLLIILVFVFGFVHDRSLLLLCSYGMLILLILNELIRYYKIGILGNMIQELLVIFLDEKDTNSSLILSHIYLLIGLSFPFWFSSFNEFNLAELSGLITVGIGDSFASIVGSKFGKHKLPRSNKTVEGSLAMVFSQLFFYILLIQIGLIDLTHYENYIFILVNLSLSGYVEAFTKDNDNVVLPIVIYPFLYLIK
ncbi:unnamed protein product [Brachionus calyciflorus]|uniref:dolichol kinase n=1 Tax=Brachionus calyciflorus TaxID=104777 RepID=A0A813RVV0_9BILA|nr:unnamed protein product [Brachionus calyciflorus]